MNSRELEELDLGIELALNNQPQAAYFIFSRLRESYPHNSPLLALCAITSLDRAEAQAAIETAIRLDPANPFFPVGKNWLEEHKLPQISRPAGFPVDSAPVETAAQIATTPLTKATVPSPEVTTPPLTATSKPVQDATNAAKPAFVPFSLTWWIRLGCSLVFFGAAMMLLYLFVTANNLNDTEKTYFERVSQLNQKISVINAQVQAAAAEFNAGKLEKTELEGRLQQVSDLDQEFRSLKSPSPRFDKLDGLLGEAFNYFDDGATNLVNGLKTNDSGLLNEGNRLINLGNDYLRQARDELRALGG